MISINRKSILPSVGTLFQTLTSVVLCLNPSRVMVPVVVSAPVCAALQVQHG